METSQLRSEANPKMGGGGYFFSYLANQLILRGPNFCALTLRDYPQPNIIPNPCGRGQGRPSFFI